MTMEIPTPVCGLVRNDIKIGMQSAVRAPPVPALAQGHFNQGMIAPGNHWNFDSLRAAPPSQVRGARTRAALKRVPFNDSKTVTALL